MSIKFKKIVLKTISSIKQGRIDLRLPIYDKSGGDVIAFLKPITNSTLSNLKKIKLLKKWRQENSFAFPSQFKVTLIGTIKWTEQLINDPARILFFIEDAKSSSQVGHLGFYSFNFNNDSCEIDNVVRGDKKRLKGIMTPAMNILIQWAMDKLQPKNIFLRVFSDNERAVSFYERCRFRKYALIPLEITEKQNVITWHENKKIKKPQKFFLKMIYTGNRITT